jgi:hypothetical protein
VEVKKMKVKVKVKVLMNQDEVSSSVK